MMVAVTAPVAAQAVEHSAPANSAPANSAPANSAPSTAAPEALDRAAARANWATRYGRKFKNKVNDRKWKWVSRQLHDRYTVKGLKALRKKGRMILDPKTCYADGTDGSCDFSRTGRNVGQAGDYFSLYLTLRPSGKVTASGHFPD